jgi:hypothetical protein
MPLVDEDTRRLLLKKTWCHGQLVLPLFAVWYFLLFVQGSAGLVFLYAALVLPAWSYGSWVYVRDETNNTISRHQFLAGGCLVELAHLGVLLSACRDLSSTQNLFLVIVSGLFLVETAAFLMVVAFCRRPASHSHVSISDFVDDARYNSV